jgi:hypothetical protein
MAVALLTCLSTVDVLFVEITESISTYREKHILNFTRLHILYNDTNSLDLSATDSLTAFNIPLVLSYPVSSVLPCTRAMATTTECKSNELRFSTANYRLN